MTQNLFEIICVTGSVICIGSILFVIGYTNYDKYTNRRITIIIVLWLVCVLLLIAPELTAELNTFNE